MKNDKGYQGEYSDFDDDLSWNDFDLRTYDPQIGRWLQQDPYDEFSSPYVGMGNDPVNEVDEDGGSLASHATKIIKKVSSTGLFDVSVKAVRHVVKKPGFWQKVSNGLVKALDVATDVLPVVSGIKDVYNGIKEGDALKVIVGAATIVADGLTAGGASLAAKGFVKLASNGLIATAKKTFRTASEKLLTKKSGTVLAGVVKTKSRGLWKLTKEAASQIKNHDNWGKFYKSKSDGLWWAVDKTGHGESKFKVFKETDKGLEWYKDADEFGDFIKGKHKGPTGMSIPWKELSK